MTTQNSRAFAAPRGFMPKILTPQQRKEIAMDDEERQRSGELILLVVAITIVCGLGMLKLLETIKPFVMAELEAARFAP